MYGNIDPVSGRPLDTAPALTLTAGEIRQKTAENGNPWNPDINPEYYKQYEMIHSLLRNNIVYGSNVYIDITVVRDELWNQTNDYIQTLRDRGVGSALTNQYQSMLNSLKGNSDQLLQNAYKNIFSDQNQISNQNDPYITCFPTSVAIALSKLGIANPLAAIGKQYADVLTDLIKNDPKLYNIVKNDTSLPQSIRDHPWTAGDVEKTMINKYFGSQVQAMMHQGWNPQDSSSIGTKNMNGTMQAIGNYLDKGTQVVMGTELTGPGGHVIDANSANAAANAYATDPAGSFEAGYGKYNYYWNSADSSNTTGANEYLSDINIQEYGVAKVWFMTISPNYNR
jgi:hypothetical protein